MKLLVLFLLEHGVGLETTLDTIQPGSNGGKAILGFLQRLDLATKKLEFLFLSLVIPL